jgi:DNA-binding SARP family transcriptional activator
MNPGLHIALFGEWRVQAGGRDLTGELPGRQGRALLAYLVLRHPQPVVRDELLQVLWPSNPPAAPDAALSSVLAKVRRAVGPGTIAGRDVLALQLPAGAAVDLLQVRDRVEAAERELTAGRAERAIDAAGAAARVLESGLLAGMQGEWVDAARRETSELASRALEVVARAGIALGGPQLVTATRAAETLVGRHPFREAGYALLMEAQGRRGDVAEALRTFEGLRVRLRDELGVGPSPPLLALHERLLRSGVTGPPRPAAADAGEAWLQRLMPAAADGSFVGREACLERLRERWRDSRAGQTGLVLLVGESGVGKTRLATRFAADVFADGGQVLYGRADEDALVAYQPFAEALRQLLRQSDPPLDDAADRRLGVLHRLLPDLEPPQDARAQPAAFDAETVRYRLFECVAGLLGEAAARRPLLLVLDDLHWADKPTMLLLRHVLRHAEAGRMLVVGTFRHVKLGRSHPLVDVLADLRRERRYDRLTLDGLDAAATAALVADRIDRAVTPGFVRRLREQTEGNAFFIEETIRAVLDAREPVGEAITEEHLDRLGVPEGVAEVIQRRVRRLPALAAEVLTAAAVVGREFPLPVVERLVDAPLEDVLCALEDSLRAGLIVELPERVDAFAFAHALVREVLYNELSAIRRVRAHLRVAEALEALSGAQPVNPAELAHHFHLARHLAGPEPARRYAVAAGQRAVELLAYEEAAEHFRRAAALFGDDESGRCEVLLALGRVQWHAGDSEARQTFLTAAHSAGRRGDATQLARAALGLGERYWEADYGGAGDRALLEEAVSAIGPAPSRLRALLLTRLAVNVAFAGELERAGAVSGEALAMARGLGDDDVLVAALLARHGTRLDVRHLDERLSLSEELAAREGGHRELSAECRQWRIYDLLEADQHEAARREQLALDALAVELRQPLFHSIAAGWRGVWAELAGDVEEAERCAERCLRHGQRAHLQDAVSSWAASLFMLRRRQSRLDELAPVVERLARGTARRTWRSALALLRVEAGDLGGAREIYEQELADGPEALPRGLFWMTTVALLSEVCAVLEDSAGASALYAALLPYAHRTVVVGHSSCWGPVERHLGLLAVARGDRDAAAHHLRRAMTRTQAMGARLLAQELAERSEAFGLTPPRRPTSSRGAQPRAGAS